MLVYLAACNIAQYRAAANKPNNNVLLSYHYWNSKLNVDRINGHIKAEANNIFIDSGAFSAYNSGKEIDIQKYIDFIKLINVKNYAALDVIGDPVKTYENTKIMQDQGLNPIPTFHMGTSIDHLEKLLFFDYIALGGMVASPNIDNWLKGVWQYIQLNKPGLKVHGFGLTDVEIVKNYPWHSVDSTSWHTIGRNGTVQLWNHAKNNFYRLSDTEYIQKNNITAKGNELEYIADSESAKHFQYFEDYLNTKKDFNHLTAQQTLF